MNNGYKRTFAEGPRGTEYTESGANYIYTINEVTTGARFSERVRVKNDRDLATLIIDLLNNPPTTPRPEDPMHQTAFTVSGHAHVIRGSREACEAVSELVQFFIEHSRQRGLITNVEGKPRLEERDNRPSLSETNSGAGNNNWHNHHFDRAADFERRLRELEKNVYALSVTPPTYQEYVKRQQALAEWVMQFGK
jgi:hypothetical protein